MRSAGRQALTLAGISLFLAGPVAGQFKPKLPRLQVGGAKQEQAAGPTPTFNDRLLEITDARVNQLLKGYAAEATALAATDQKRAEARRVYEEENQAHGVRLKEYEKKKKEWDACQEREVKPAQAKAEKEAEKSQDKITGGDQEAFEKRMQQVQERIQAAQAKGDMAEVMRLADSLSKSMAANSAAASQAGTELQAAAGKCGSEPTQPQPPAPPSDGQPNLDAEGAKASGLTQDQYALMKERVQYAVSEDCTVKVASSNWAFSASEIDVLKKRGPELCKATEPLRRHGT